MKELLKKGLALFRTRTDEELMLQVKQGGDCQAFAQLVSRSQAKIQVLCTRLTGDPQRGEDLAQETFARLFANRRGYSPTARFTTYLWRIALNLCHDEARRKQRRREILSDESAAEVVNDLAEDAMGPDASASKKEEGELVRQALQQLPEIYRTVLVLRHYEDMKLARIAEVLEIPEGTVNSRMAEGLAQLGRLLQPRLHGQPAAAKPVAVIRPPEEKLTT